MQRKLTDAKVKNIRPKDKAFKTSDGGGLYLYTTKSGSKSWRYDFKLNGKWITMTFGLYPAISLAEARELHNQAHISVSNNIDPRQTSQHELAHNNFSFYALDAIKRQALSERTEKKKIQMMDLYLFKELDKKQITEISAIDLLNLIDPIAKEGKHETARRLASYCRQVFDNLLSMQIVAVNPAESLHRLLPKLKIQENFAHVTDEKSFAILLNGADQYHGDFVVKKALQFMPLVFLRPRNIRFLKWSYINFKQKLITIPAEEMKMKREHKVPLSKQALKILNEVKPLTDNQELVFTAHAKSTAMSENTLNNAIKRFKNPENGKALGKGFMTSHGYRHTASTFLNEQSFNTDAIELQLAHLDKDRIRRTYNKAELLPERTKMMQEWADYLDDLKHEK